MTELPDSIIADTLNQKVRNVNRSHRSDDAIPRLHVSSIIKSGTQNFFCPREFVLRYMDGEEAEGSGIPSKFALLWAVGHFYGEYIVNQFLQRNPEWGKYAWGDWSCGCPDPTVVYKQHRPTMQCDSCNGHVNKYLETDLFNPAKTVVGHADLIFLVDRIFYIYEFKSIERADIPFDTLEAPLGDHIVQASNYFYMVKALIDSDPDLVAKGYQISRNIRFVYVDRAMDGLYTKKPFKEFQARRIAARRLRNFYLRAKECHTSIKNGVLPERICEDITCARAKQCSRAISCFNRTRQKVKRIVWE